MQINCVLRVKSDRQSSESRAAGVPLSYGGAERGERAKEDKKCWTYADWALFRLPEKHPRQRREYGAASPQFFQEGQAARKDNSEGSGSGRSPHSKQILLFRGLIKGVGKRAPQGGGNKKSVEGVPQS